MANYNVIIIKPSLIKYKLLYLHTYEGTRILVSVSRVGILTTSTFKIIQFKSDGSLIDLTSDNEQTGTLCTDL